ncbi:restriction endonuclease [Sphingobacteriaceae bacterium WQ 2009]|uniref:Restriction endonuclease n=1 Tax=Rhinopithecimicrobium faecis TaxID=2820698 RepID=A0A8T4H9I1_9SPHI|nr:restriction endonuclease [Sphingobacteriaceae bacterium WQ 2009]
MNVKKYSGELIPFNADSLKGSLAKSGASPELTEKVYQTITEKLYDGITTKELYKIAFQELKQLKNTYAARYSLKKAMRDLGPEGFYFEKWVAALLKEGGFQTITGKIVQGNAVTHEIDVIAAKDTEMLAIECKFRNDIDAKITVTTPMYFLSRFKDICDKSYTYFEKERKFTQGWLATNTYFTKDAINFAEYYHINLLSWDYPVDKSIKRRVDSAALYPITCLTSITKLEKDKLLAKRCILVKELAEQPELLDDLTMTNAKKKRTLNEAHELIKIKQEGA